MTFKSMKFHVKNPEESEAVQKKLIKLGYVWYNNSKAIKGLDKPYLYVSDFGIITYGNTTNLFTARYHEEMNVQEFIKPSRGDVLPGTLVRTEGWNTGDFFYCEETYESTKEMQEEDYITHMQSQEYHLAELEIVYLPPEGLFTRKYCWKKVSLNKLKNLKEVEKENNAMTTLEQQIKDTQEQLEKLTSALQGENCKPKEWPQYGDTNFYVSSSGVIGSAGWNDGLADRDCKAMHNCFKTKAEAEYYRDWLKSPVTHARYLLQKFADEYNGDWKYNPRHNTGYFINADKINTIISYDCRYAKDTIYFKDTVGCQKAIEVLGEETIKLACGVV